MGERLTIGSLFSGVGGLELGLERAGLGPVLWQAESDPYCRRVLARHWPEARRYTDVRHVDAHADRVDVVCGGFPCQPVSVAGQRRAQADERWLWPEFARVVRELRPAWVVAENVPGLRSAGLRDVLADLAALGFDAEWSCLSAAQVGAPHLRRRLFLVASHPDRASLRDEPGWLGRACGSAAAVASDDGAGGVAPDAARVDRDEGRRVFVPPREPDVDQGAWGAEADAPPDPLGSRLEGAPRPRAHGRVYRDWSEAAHCSWARDSGWRHAPPAVRRVDDGLPAGLDACVPDAVRGLGEARGDEAEAPDGWRVAALGNAVVPQVAEVIGRAIVEVSRG